MFIILYLIIAFFLIAFAIKRPIIAVPLIIFLTMVFERLFSLTPLVFGDNILKIYPLDIAIIASLIVYWRRGHFQNFRFGFLELMITLFIIICVINFVRSYFGFGSDIENAFSTFKNYVFYSALYFLTIANLSQSHFNGLHKAFVVGGIFILPLFIIGFITGQPFFGEFTPLSTQGTRSLAPSYAFYILIALLVVLAQPDIFKPKNLNNFNSASLISFLSNQRFRPIIIWLFILAILLSLSRHLYLALILGLYLIWRYLVDSRPLIIASLQKPFIGAIISFFLIYLFFSYLVPGANLTLPDFFTDVKTRLESFLDPSDVSFDYRLAFWKESFLHFLANPLIGIGFGQEITFPVAGALLTMPARELHNSLYAILLQMGIIGFLPLLFIIIWGSIKFFRQNDKEKSALYFALLAIFLFSSLFGTYFEINLLVIFFWIFLAMFKRSLQDY